MGKADTVFTAVTPEGREVDSLSLAGAVRALGHLQEIQHDRLRTEQVDHQGFGTHWNVLDGERDVGFVVECSLE